MSLDGDHYVQKYYKLIKLFMCTIGQWPYQAKKSAKILTFITVCFQATFIIPQVIKLIKEMNNTDLVIEILALLIDSLTITIVLNTIRNDWKNLKDKEEIKILSKYSLYGKLMGYTYCCILVSSSITYLFLPFIPYILDIINPLNETRPREPKPAVDYCIDEEKYSFLILLHFTLSITSALLLMLAIDTFFVSCVQHNCGLFAILEYRLKSTENSALLKTNIFDVIKLGMGVMGQTMHLLYYCIQGQSLMEHSDTIFYSMWYNSPIKVKKLTMMMMMRSAKQCKLTAKMYELSLSTFMEALLKTNIFDVIKLGMGVMGQTMHLLYYCIQGQSLMEHSDTIFYSM
ncbi:uncharacterized protein LOC111642909 [Copidosoma floridanum]|uniref:uncharacterized protein LOC111642909 n=1 Tax=Copidosoma floridanum TaxID=29053 RepID=UPI000C6F62FF|nr:uncharacterized protein LOC111642909 [Copidosoma floridanum]